MKKLTKTLAIIGGAALAAGLTPYHFKSDKEAGSFEIGALLWALKKTPGEEKDTYTLDLLPFLNKKEEPAEQAITEPEA